jgi:hypothetical protein
LSPWLGVRENVARHIPPSHGKEVKTMSAQRYRCYESRDKWAPPKRHSKHSKSKSKSKSHTGHGHGKNW